MLKRDRKKRKLGNTGRTRRTKRKVLMKVSAFFYIHMLHIINDIYGTLGSEIVAGFKMKTEHENLHRNNEKNSTLKPLPDQ
jgi:hypothetical protein